MTSDREVAGAVQRPVGEGWDYSALTFWWLMLALADTLFALVLALPPYGR